VLIPEENAKDLADIPEEVKAAIDIRPVAIFDEVLKLALVRQPEPMTWEQAEAKAPMAPDADGTARITAH
jgi:ATP-dependent Lon protease